MTIFITIIFALQFLILSFISSTGGQQITVINNCAYNAWPSFQAAPEQPIPFNGGADMLPANGGSLTFDVPNGWTSGRVWARMGCENGMDKCTSGGCGVKLRQ